jgi:DUF4097 and DUF4098 domain-containing protein YvlB
MDPVRLSATSGRVRVVAEARDGLLVEAGDDRSADGNCEVHGGGEPVAVRVPIGTDLVIGTDSARVTVEGTAGEVRVTSESGRIEVARCEGLDVRTRSGRIAVGEVAGDARIRSATGRILVGHVAGTLRIDSTSGRVEVSEVNGAVTATTVEGRLTIGLGGTQSACCESVSGRIDLSIPAGVAPRTSMRAVDGRCTSEVPEGAAPDITARTVSGRITLRSRNADG